MGPQRFKTVERLYHAVLTVEPGRRADFLREACRGDESLRLEVESLLDLNQQTESFIDRPAVEVMAELLGGELSARATMDIPRLRPSELIGDRFEVVASIGHGGMGDVYEVKDLYLSVHVALKTIRYEFASDERMIARFKQEILLAKTVTHPNVCRMYDVGFHSRPEHDKDSTGGRQPKRTMFLTMELLKGESLSDRLRRGRMTSSEAFPLVEQIAAGLDAAHQAGIVHRDFKSANIMLVPSANGRTRAVVTDFGLARNIVHRQYPAAAVSLTQTGEIRGTPDYMAPEQVLGAQVTCAADIYALGIVMYEMLTGKRPFNAETPFAIAAKRLHETPLLPHRYVADLDPTWETVIMRCMERDPAARFSSAVDVSRALSGVSAVSLPPQPIVSRRSILLAGLGAAGCIGGSIALWRGFHREVPNSVAILPFRNVDPAQDYLSEGMTDDLISTLGQRQALRVMSRPAVYAYKDTDFSPQELGRRLRVLHVLTGRLLRKGNSISVRAELTTTGDGMHVWGQQYEHQVSEILAIEEDISREVLSKLRFQFGAQDVRRFRKRRSAAPEINELYWRGRFFWNKNTEASIQRAIEYFSEAVEKDSKFAPAYAGLADCYAKRTGVVPPNEIFPKVKTAALKALQLDDMLAEAHATLALVRAYFDWDWKQAESQFKRAIQLNPSYSSAHSAYGLYLVAMSRVDEGLAQMNRALEVEPSSLEIDTNIGRALFYGRRYQDAAAQFAKILDTDPTIAEVLFDMGATRAAEGKYDEAIALLDRGLKSKGDHAGAMAQITYTLRQAGREAQADGMNYSLDELSRRRYVSPYFLAVAQVGTDNSRTLDLLEQAFRDRSTSLIYLNVDPHFDSLRAHPAYLSLLQRLGFGSS